MPKVPLVEVVDPPQTPEDLFQPTPEPNIWNVADNEALFEKSKPESFDPYNNTGNLLMDYAAHCARHEILTHPALLRAPVHPPPPIVEEKKEAPLTSRAKHSKSGKMKKSATLVENTLRPFVVPDAPHISELVIRNYSLDRGTLKCLSLCLGDAAGISAVTLHNVEFPSQIHFDEFLMLISEIPFRTLSLDWITIRTNGDRDEEARRQESLIAPSEVTVTNIVEPVTSMASLGRPATPVEGEEAPKSDTESNKVAEEASDNDDEEEEDQEEEEEEDIPARPVNLTKLLHSAPEEDDSWNMTTLSIQGNMISDEDGKQFFTTFETIFPQVTSLNFNNNLLSDQTGDAIALLLKSNTTLTSLSLFHNRLTYESVHNISLAMSYYHLSKAEVVERRRQKLRKLTAEARENDASKAKRSSRLKTKDKKPDKKTTDRKRKPSSKDIKVLTHNASKLTISEMAPPLTPETPSNSPSYITTGLLEIDGAFYNQGNRTLQVLNLCGNLLDDRSQADFVKIVDSNEALTNFYFDGQYSQLGYVEIPEEEKEAILMVLKNRHDPDILIEASELDSARNTPEPAVSKKNRSGSSMSKRSRR